MVRVVPGGRHEPVLDRDSGTPAFLRVAVKAVHVLRGERGKPLEQERKQLEGQDRARGIDGDPRHHRVQDRLRGRYAPHRREHLPDLPHRPQRLPGAFRADARALGDRPPYLALERVVLPEEVVRLRRALHRPHCGAGQGREAQRVLAQMLPVKVEVRLRPSRDVRPDGPHAAIGHAPDPVHVERPRVPHALEGERARMGGVRLALREVHMPRAAVRERVGAVARVVGPEDDVARPAGVRHRPVPERPRVLHRVAVPAVALRVDAPHREVLPLHRRMAVDAAVVDVLRLLRLVLHPPAHAGERPVADRLQMAFHRHFQAAAPGGVEEAALPRLAHARADVDGLHAFHVLEQALGNLRGRPLHHDALQGRERAHEPAEPLLLVRGGRVVVELHEPDAAHAVPHLREAVRVDRLHGPLVGAEADRVEFRLLARMRAPPALDGGVHVVRRHVRRGDDKLPVPVADDLAPPLPPRLALDVVQARARVVPVVPYRKAAPLVDDDGAALGAETLLRGTHDRAVARHVRHLRPLHARMQERQRVDPLLHALREVRVAQRPAFLREMVGDPSHLPGERDLRHAIRRTERVRGHLGEVLRYHDMDDRPPVLRLLPRGERGVLEDAAHLRPGEPVPPPAVHLGLVRVQRVGGGLQLRRVEVLGRAERIVARGVVARVGNVAVHLRVHLHRPAPPAAFLGRPQGASVPVALRVPVREVGRLLGRVPFRPRPERRPVLHGFRPSDGFPVETLQVQVLLAVEYAAEMPHVLEVVVVAVGVHVDLPVRVPERLRLVPETLVPVHVGKAEQEVPAALGAVLRRRRLLRHPVSLRPRAHVVEEARLSPADLQLHLRRPRVRGLQVPRLHVGARALPLQPPDHDEQRRVQAHVLPQSIHHVSFHVSPSCAPSRRIADTPSMARGKDDGKAAGRRRPGPRSGQRPMA